MFLIFVLAIFLVACAQNIVQQNDVPKDISPPAEIKNESKPQEKAKLCQSYVSAKANAIHLCKNSKEDELYLQMYYCEDCPISFFNINKELITSCCTGECSDKPSEICQEPRGYTCDSSKNLLSDLCEEKKENKSAELVPIDLNKIKEENLTKSNQSMLPSSRCKDTDVDPSHPDGINFELKGEILINGNKIINGYDYCANTQMISEWYCLNGIARVKTTKCANGCKDGVCL